MKKLLYSFTMFLMGIGVLSSFSSCLDDDEDDGYTQAEMAAAMNVMKGTYNGRLLYSNSLYNTPDTIENVRVRVDSLITILNFPMSTFAKGTTIYTDSTLVADIEALGTTQLKCQVGFYSIENSYYTLNVMPYTVQFTARANNVAYTCLVPFLNGDSNSMGIYSIADNYLQFQMYTYRLYLDGTIQNTMIFETVYYQFQSDYNG